MERYEQINQIKKYLYNLQNRNKAKVSAIDLLLMDDIEKKYFKSLKSLDIDTKAKNIFPASDVLDMCRHPLQAVYKIQIRTNPQCLMLAIATFNSLFFKAIPGKSVQYWAPMSKLHASF